MTDRVPCKNTNCNRTILPATAEKTGGLCMVCVNQKAAEERRQYIEQNRKAYDSVPPYENIASMTAEQVLQMKCPKCSGGLTICYGSETRMNYLSVQCRNFAHCPTGYNLDGLPEPAWLGILPNYFKTDGNAGFEEIIQRKQPPQKFRIGHRVRFMNGKNLEEAIVRDIVWNFTRKCWDYLLSQDGKPVRLRFQEYELDSI